MENPPKRADTYSEVLGRLQHVVESLEKGELSLEESLERFADGVRLVKHGEQMLKDAEQRIERLLSEDGHVAPLEVASPPPSPSAPARPAPAPAPAPSGGRAPPPSVPADDDIPF